MSAAYLAVQQSAHRSQGQQVATSSARQSSGPHWQALKQKADRNLQTAGVLERLGVVAQMQSTFLCIYMCV